MNNRKFPESFFWGTATSAHQIEGGQNNDWAEWEPGHIKDGSVSGKACDSWNKYPEDFDLVQQLNNNAYRFSVEWSRIEPQEEKWDEDAISRYQKMVQNLKQRGIEPFVTLHHFTNPKWFAKKGGWENKQAPELFNRYCQRIVESLPEVNYWIPINEPDVYTETGFLAGHWLPQKKSPLAAKRVRNNLVKAHQLAYQSIKKTRPEAEVGIAKNLIAFDPYRSWRPTDRLAARIGHRWHNCWFLERIVKQLDFIGINYYFHSRVKLKLYQSSSFFKDTVPKSVPVTDAGWEIYPDGLGRMIKHAAQYKKPIYITENGIADVKDEKRKQFIYDHLAVLHQKIQEGYDIKGYFHWSLMDNFEWQEGFKNRFGLVAVDFKTQERKIRPSGEYYAQISGTNQLQ